MPYHLSTILVASEKRGSPEAINVRGRLAAASRIRNRAGGQVIRCGSGVASVSTTGENRIVCCLGTAVSSDGAFIHGFGARRRHGSSEERLRSDSAENVCVEISFIVRMMNDKSLPALRLHGTCIIIPR